MSFLLIVKCLHTLEDMISSLLVEEKRATAGDSQLEATLYSKKRIGRRMIVRVEFSVITVEKHVLQ